jgi:ubiquinone/menaquinone biosynthesis C-methylase UbiE
MDRVEWREADACALPFPNQAFDKVVCQFGVMFFPDERVAFRKKHRGLRPGGEFLSNTWEQVGTKVWFGPRSRTAAFDDP